jgi:hypothetical protein
MLLPGRGRRLGGAIGRGASGDAVDAADRRRGGAGSPRVPPSVTPCIRSRPVGSRATGSWRPGVVGRWGGGAVGRCRWARGRASAGHRAAGRRPSSGRASPPPRPGPSRFRNFEGDVLSRLSVHPGVRWSFATVVTERRVARACNESCKSSQEANALPQLGRKVSKIFGRNLVGGDEQSYCRLTLMARASPWASRAFTHPRETSIRCHRASQELRREGPADRADASQRRSRPSPRPPSGSAFSSVARHLPTPAHPKARPPT